MTPQVTGPVAVLANPDAGRGRHRGEVPAALARLRATGREVTMLRAESVDGALAACRDAVAGGAGALVAIGGDGTVNLAMQAVAGTGIGFGAIPTGTGNDFVREIGLPGDVAGAAEVAARAVETGTRRTVDLARMVPDDGPQRWFGAVLGAGFDAIVNERANRMRFPRGPRRYDVAIVAELLRLKPRRYAITLDGHRHEMDAVLVAVGNTPSYGGGMRICPAADATDGLIDLVVVGPIGRATFVRIKPQVYAGTHVDHPAVTSYRATTIGIAADGITAYVDGERSSRLPVTVHAEPGALSLLAP
ncbi:MAG TPA: diacylglycerol kinase family protein [Micromonosporaceae bacterium]|jgi:diacylglycerol kinase (ATP)